MDIADSKCVALTTYRRNGTAVTNPVWITKLSDGRFGFYTAMGTGKTKRLKHDPHITLQPCSWGGKVKPDSTVVHGTAELHQHDPLYEETITQVKKKYGLMAKLALFTGPRMLKKQGLTYADTAVVVRLDD